MAVLTIPDEKKTLDEFESIKRYLDARGILIEQWQARVAFGKEATQNEILDAYAHALKPYMQKNGYTVADVIAVHPQTPNLPELQAKFLREHTHSEDEVRFFVEGQGDFWFHLENADTDSSSNAKDASASGASSEKNSEVFYVTCQAGDLISVPKGYKHWFDMGPTPLVKVIRIFIDPSGWVPEYTDSGIEKRYQPVGEAV